jgi:ribose 5-phosphate isomerase B
MATRKILIASDHAGFEIKEKLKSEIKDVEFIDLGPKDTTSVDYPDFAKKLSTELLNGSTKEGILVCGSGQGMVIQANRFKGIRAALCWTPEVAKLSREHNNSNVLCLAGRLVDENTNIEISKTWLNTPFLGGRHQNRVEKIDK